MSPRPSAESVRDLGKRVKKRVVGPRRGARRAVGHVITQLPHYGRLLAGLMTDRRVSKLDRLLVGVALAYLLMPLDFIADYVPFLGQVDDVFLLMTALQRLTTNAGRRVLRDHWTGDARELRHLDIPAVVNAAAFFLPGRMRSSLLGLLR